MNTGLHQDYVMRGLTGLYRLAQQDLLRASMSANPIYWHHQALDRMQTYEKLLMGMETDGLSDLYRETLQEYQSLCKDRRFSIFHGSDRGRKQALEMFLVLCKGCKESVGSCETVLHRPLQEPNEAEYRTRDSFLFLGSGSRVENGGAV